MAKRGRPSNNGEPPSAKRGRLADDADPGDSANALRGYRPGMHGWRRYEQTRLQQEYNTQVTGSEFESEHAVGFEPLNRTSGFARGTAGRPSILENRAPAYQEIRELHRGHIGTGNRGYDRNDSGFTSRTYRDAQRGALEDSDASSAVQLNQLDYAFNPRFGQLAGSTEGQAATDSYNLMVREMTEFTYAQGAQDVTFTVSKGARIEMMAARRMAQTGNWDVNALQRLGNLDIDMDSTAAMTNAEAEEILEILAAIL
ncbi:MAG: hypothetical protein KDJ14_08785 [Xanthomonadales bacterium]|nr:hypothetical protein [Xanthomonadales bacterium]